MKRIKILLMTGLIYGIFQVNLFSVISSRVEGLITDMDTGIPIEGVMVRIMLYGGNVDLAAWETQTDKKGYFKFDFEDVGQEYYLQCNKDGYIPILPRYYDRNLRKNSPDIFKKLVNLFYLKEGQIKNFKISLEKGGTLKGKIFKINSSGLSPYVGVPISLFRNRVDSDNNIFPENVNVFYLNNVTVTNGSGEFSIKGLEPFVYNLVISSNEYPSTEIENIEVRKNEVKTVEYTVDLTNPTGLKGTIKIKNVVPENGAIGLSVIENGKPSPYEVCGSDIKKDGGYSCMGLSAGRYHLFVICKDINGFIYEKRIDVGINPGETRVLNLNLNEGDKKIEN